MVDGLSRFVAVLESEVFRAIDSKGLFFTYTKYKNKKMQGIYGP